MLMCFFFPAVLFLQYVGTHSLNGPFVKLFQGITPQQSLCSQHLLCVDGRAVLTVVTRLKSHLLFVSLEPKPPIYAA